MPQNPFFSSFFLFLFFFFFFLRTRNLLVSQKTTQRHFFFNPPSPFHSNFCNCNSYCHLYCFAILGSTSTVIHSVRQHLLKNQPGSALRPLTTSCAKDYKAHSLQQTSFTESPNRKRPFPAPSLPKISHFK